MDKNLNIVFFDGYCNLCNRSVDFLIRVDSRHLLCFAPLTGDTARKYRIEQSELLEEQSIVYLKSLNQVYTQSDAVIEIFHDVFLLGKIFLLLKVIPKKIRDYLYKKVAANRFRFFGKKETCRLPSPKERSRFLD